MSLQHFLKKPYFVALAACCIGFILVWVFLKAFQPIMRSVCVRVLEVSEDKTERRQGRVVSVEVETITPQPMPRYVSSVGKIRANANVRIRAEMNGRIKEIVFKEGAVIKAGDVILKFENAELLAELRETEANLALKKADFERALQLKNKNAGSFKDYDRAKAEYDVAQGRCDVAKVKVDKSEIRAPFSGVMGLLDVTVGSYVQAAQEIVTLVDTAPVMVDFKVPEQYVHEVGVGQSAEVRVDAFKDRVFVASIVAVDPVVDDQSHSVILRGSIPNEDENLKPGLFANVSLFISEKSDALSVDESAIDREGKTEFVWIVVNQKASRVPILTGLRKDGRVEVVAGLKPDMIVVIAGQLRLSDGVRVRIVENQKKKEKAKSISDFASAAAA